MPTERHIPLDRVKCAGTRRAYYRLDGTVLPVELAASTYLHTTEHLETLFTENNVILDLAILWQYQELRRPIKGYFSLLGNQQYSINNIANAPFENRSISDIIEAVVSNFPMYTRERIFRIHNDDFILKARYDTILLFVEKFRNCIDLSRLVTWFVFERHLRGMPDLFCPDSTQIDFVEVKSSNDKLSLEQSQSLQQLEDSFGMSCQVIHIDDLSVGYLDFNPAFSTEETYNRVCKILDIEEADISGIFGTCWELYRNPPGMPLSDLKELIFLFRDCGLDLTCRSLLSLLLDVSRPLLFDEQIRKKSQNYSDDLDPQNFGAIFFSQVQSRDIEQIASIANHYIRRLVHRNGRLVTPAEAILSGFENYQKSLELVMSALEAQGRIRATREHLLQTMESKIVPIWYATREIEKNPTQALDTYRGMIERYDAEPLLILCDPRPLAAFLERISLVAGRLGFKQEALDACNRLVNIDNEMACLRSKATAKDKNSLPYGYKSLSPVTSSALDRIKKRKIRIRRQISLTDSKEP